MILRGQATRFWSMRRRRLIFLFYFIFPFFTPVVPVFFHTSSTLSILLKIDGQNLLELFLNISKLETLLLIFMISHERNKSQIKRCWVLLSSLTMILILILSTTCFAN